MNIVITKHRLLKALKQVKNAISSKSTFPILSEIYFRADGEGLTLIGGGIDITIEAIIPSDQVKVIKEGKITLPGAKITEIIEKMKEEVVIETNGLVATIRSGNSKFEVPGMDADEYPPLPVITGNRFEIASEVLVSMINKTIHSANQKTDGNVLEGISFKTSDGQLQFITTDRHRLSLVTTQIDDTEINDSIIVPVVNMKELVKIIDRGVIEIIPETNQFIINTSEYTFYSRILEGEYPDVKKMIPNVFNSEIRIDTEKLIEAFERTMIVAKEEEKGKTNQVNMKVTDKVALYAENKTDKTEEFVDFVELIGESFEISFNCKFAIDALKAIDEKEIMFQFTTPTSPLVIRGVGNDKELHLILPYRRTAVDR